MNNSEFNIPILNIVSIPLIVLSLFSYYQGEFNLFLLFATIIVLLNFDNNWYKHWIVLVFSGPIFANLFLNSTLNSVGKSSFFREVGFILIGTLVYAFLVSLIKDIFKYLTRKKIIRTYRESLNEKIISILNNLDRNNANFTLKLAPLSDKVKINDEAKVKLLEHLANNFNSQLKTLEFKDMLFGSDNRKILSSLKKYLEIKNILSNYRISNTNSSMSILKDIKTILEKNNISLEFVEKVYKAMDYEVISKLQKQFLADYNSYVLNPRKNFFVNNLHSYNSYKYIENIQLKINKAIVELEDILISDAGVFLVEKYYEPMSVYKLQVDISGDLIKYYTSDEIRVDNKIYKEITSKAMLLEKFINSKLTSDTLNGKALAVTPIILIDQMDISIENKSTLKIIESSRLEETIEGFQDKLPKDAIDSIINLMISLKPEPSTFEYEFPSPNMLNLVQLGLVTMNLIDELYDVIFKEAAEFINKYKP